MKKLIAAKKRTSTKSQQKWAADCRAEQNDINWSTAHMLAYDYTKSTSITSWGAA